MWQYAAECRSARLFVLLCSERSKHVTACYFATENIWVGSMDVADSFEIPRSEYRARNFWVGSMDATDSFGDGFGDLRNTQEELIECDKAGVAAR
eukprot:1627937-Pyramimonas_sp.AAC.1